MDRIRYLCNIRTDFVVSNCLDSGLLVLYARGISGGLWGVFSVDR